MAIDTIKANAIFDGAVDTADLATGAVTSAKLDTNIDIAGTLDVTGVLTADSNASVAGDLTVDTNTLYVDSSNNRVGVGTGSPQKQLHINYANANSGQMQITNTSTGTTSTDGVLFGYNASNDVIVNNQEATRTVFYTNGAERMSILSSGGLTFNGDTAATNALDDYEEGTWTPAIAFGGGSTGLTYNIQNGSYVKVGGFVHLQGYININNKGSSTGTATMTGLPFPNTTDTNSYTSHQIGHGGDMLSYADWNIYIAPGADFMYFAGGNPPPNHNAGLNNSHFQSGTYFLFTITYHTKS